MQALLKKLNSLSDKQRTLLALGFFAILVLVFYGNTLGNGFVHDDINDIEKNSYVHSFTYFTNVLSGCATEDSCAKAADTYYYRPIKFLAILIIYQVVGQAWFFHLISIIVFALITTLSFLFVRRLTGNFLLSFLTALFFAIHPIQSAVVNYSSSIADLLGAALLLSTAIFFLDYRKSGSYKKLFFSLSFYVLALFTKESAIFFIALLPLVDLYQSQSIFWKNLFSRERIKLYGSFVAAAVFYGIVRQMMLGFQSGALGDFSPAERAYAFFYLLGSYIAKLLYPYPLSFSYIF